MAQEADKAKNMIYIYKEIEAIIVKNDAPVHTNDLVKAKLK